MYNRRDHEGLTPVFRASSAEKVELFLDAGLADLETRLGDDGYTLLHHCLSSFQVSRQLIRSLREQGGNSIGGKILMKILTKILTNSNLKRRHVQTPFSRFLLL